MIPLDRVAALDWHNGVRAERAKDHLPGEDRPAKRRLYPTPKFAWSTTSAIRRSMLVRRHSLWITAWMMRALVAVHVTGVGLDIDRWLRISVRYALLSTRALARRLSTNEDRYFGRPLVPHCLPWRAAM